MKKIVEILMEYGMAFEYEHNGSEGECVTAHGLGLKVRTKHDGWVLDYEGNFKEFRKFEFYPLIKTINDICIEETN